MDAKDTLYQIEFDEMAKNDEAFLCQGIKIARLHRINLSAFKKITLPISQLKIMKINGRLTMKVIFKR